MKKVLLLLASAIAFPVVGKLFRPFLLSFGEWGPLVFVALVWLVMSLAFGWGGKGRPYSIGFAMVCASGIALGLLVTIYTNPYIGVGVMLALIYMGIRTKFFD